MSRITLRNGQTGVELTHIGPDAEIAESVAGEQTIRFTVLPDDIGAVAFSTRVEYEDQYYKPKRIKWRGNALGVFAEIEAEHVAYALSDMTVETISLTGTNSAVLSRILSGTGLTAGTCISGSLSAGTLENVTRREALVTAAGLMGGELSFSGNTVSIVAHRGNTARTDLMDTGNVLSVEEQLQTDSDPIYRVTLAHRGTLAVGDDIRIRYAPLGLDVNTRIISMRRNPYNDREVTVEIGRHIPEITDKFVTQEAQVKKAQEKADTAKATADEAKATAEATQTALGNYVQTSEVSAAVDTYVNSDQGKASITASLSGTYQTIDGMTGYEKKTELSADIGAYIDTQAGTAKITAAVAGTYAEKSALGGYEKKTELSADIGAYIDTQAGTARLTAALEGTFAEKEMFGSYIKKTELNAGIETYIDTQAGTAKLTEALSGTFIEGSELDMYEKTSKLSADIGAYIDTPNGKAKVVSACSGTYVDFNGIAGYEKKSDLSTDIGQYIDGATGKAKVVSACAGTYQTVNDMAGYVTTSSLNTSIGQYIDGTTGKAKIVSACSGTYQKKDDMSGYVTTTSLNTSIGQYIDSSTGKAKVVSACSGTYAEKTDVTTEISQAVSPVESAISLTAAYGSGTIGSNVRALLQLVANADKSTITIKADKIDFSGFTTFLKAADVGSGGSTSIDGGRILTGTISADRIDVSSIKLRALYGSGTSYANVALLYSSGDDLYIGQSMSSSSTNVDMIKMRANTINIGRSDTSQLVVDNANKCIRHNYTANTANYDLGNSTHQFNNLYVKKIYIDGTELSGGGSDTLYVSGSTASYLKLSSTKDLVANGTGFSLGSSTYPFDEFYCGSSTYHLKMSSACIVPNTTSTSTSYFQLGSNSYPFNDLYVKNLHVSGSFDMAGSTVKMGGTSRYYIEANTSRELKPSSSSATYPAYLGSSSIYWHYAYIGSNTVMLGSSGSSSGSKLGFFGTTAAVRQTLSLTSDNMSYTAVTASNYLHALNNLIGILKKHGLIAT